MAENDKKTISTTLFQGETYLDDRGNTYLSSWAVYVCRGVKSWVQFADTRGDVLKHWVHLYSSALKPSIIGDIGVDLYNQNAKTVASRFILGKEAGELYFAAPGPIEATCARIKQQIDPALLEENPHHGLPHEVRTNAAKVAEKQ